MKSLSTIIVLIAIAAVQAAALPGGTVICGPGLKKVCKANGFNCDCEPIGSK
ncbi:hypothetical protein GQ54DRAFT_300042 [Martensiomyces pterosporus]|nr:hypothetical protein GQ54DRAFT_300042 [Martensiomyces pterosporus]